jgi:hypothetical protein
MEIPEENLELAGTLIGHTSISLYKRLPPFLDAL